MSAQDLAAKLGITIRDAEQAIELGLTERGTWVCMSVAHTSGLCLVDVLGVIVSVVAKERRRRWENEVEHEARGSRAAR